MEGATQQTPFILERLGRQLAARRLGEGANPQELERYAKRYESWLFTLSGAILGGGLVEGAKEGISAIRRAVSSGTAASEPTAPLPAKKLSAEGQFRWPIDDPTATVHFLRTGVLLYLRQKLYVNAAANGEVRIVERQRTMFYMPFFFIILDHRTRFQTIYSGWGIPSVKQGGSIKAHQPIATSAGYNVYFQLTRGSELVDPCSYLPPFPGVVRGMDIIPEETPFVWDLLDLSKQHYRRHASPPAISRRFLRQR
jgi:hypothetical protein